MISSDRARLTNFGMVIVFVAAIARLGHAYSNSTPDFSVPKRQVSEVLHIQQLDPDAVVLLTCGEDLAPGVARRDDDANGVVDDPSELGASRSDDLCSVASSDRLATTADRDSKTLPTLVLQRGAFVNVAPDQRKQFPDRAVRTIWLVHPDRGPTWTFVED